MKIIYLFFLLTIPTNTYAINCKETKKTPAEFVICSKENLIAIETIFEGIYNNNITNLDNFQKQHFNNIHKNLYNKNIRVRCDLPKNKTTSFNVTPELQDCVTESIRYNINELNKFIQEANVNNSQPSPDPNPQPSPAPNPQPSPDPNPQPSTPPEQNPHKDPTTYLIAVLIIIVPFVWLFKSSNIWSKVDLFDLFDLFLFKLHDRDSDKKKTRQQNNNPNVDEKIQTKNTHTEKGNPITLTALCMSGMAGLTILLNQCGQGLATIYPTLNQYKLISGLWHVNYKVGNQDGLHALSIALAVITILNFLAWFRNPSEETKITYFLGLFIGIVIFPYTLVVILSIPLLLAILSAIIYVIFWLITHVISPVLMFLAIPFIWLWHFALVPFILFIIKPIIWVWDSIILPIFELIYATLRWFWDHLISPVVNFLRPLISWILDNILIPVLEFIFTVLFKWVLIVVASILAILVSLAIVFASFGCVWRVILESFRSAIWGAFSPQTAFNSGVGIGLMTFDFFVAYGLNAFSEYSFAPSISHFILLIPPIVFTTRIIYSRFYKLPYFKSEKLSFYWNNYLNTSRLEVYVFIAVFPLLLMITLASKTQETDA